MSPSRRLSRSRSAPSKLSVLRVRGFKAIRESGSLELGPLTLLIGRNGSGKSSLVESLQWFQESLTYGLFDSTTERFGAFADVRNRRSVKSSVRIELDRGEREIRYEVWVKAQQPTLRPIVAEETCYEGRTSGSIQTIFTRKGKRGPAVRTIVGGNTVRDGDSLALGSVAGTKALGARTLKDFVRRMVFLRLSPAAMAERSRLHVGPKASLLDEEGHNLAALLASMTHQQRERISVQVAEVISGVKEIEVVRQGDLGYFATRERMLARGGTRTFRIPSWLLSEGTRRLTALFALLEMTPRPSMIAIEEVENGLDPWTLQFVFRALRKAAGEGVQVLLTTHSPFLLDHVEPGEIVHVVREQGETTFKRIDAYEEVAQYKGAVPPGAMYVSGYLKDRQ